MAASGTGLTLLPVFYARGGFGGLPLAPGQRRFVNDLDGFARLLDASRGLVAADFVTLRAGRGTVEEVWAHGRQCVAMGGTSRGRL